MELAREMATELGREERDDLERADDVEGAWEVRLDIAGDAGAGRLEVRGFESPGA